jgi:branched-subunit amino acid ABC-type transport system permease component
MSQILLSGVAMGCIYALVALGFVLIYNATGGLNFAQGELVMLGAFLFYAGLDAGLGPILSVRRLWRAWRCWATCSSAWCSIRCASGRGSSSSSPRSVSPSLRATRRC